MANLDDTGIQSIDTALVETFELEKSLKVSDPVLTSVGGFHAAQAYDPTFQFSAKGSGDIPVGIALGENALEIDGVSGGVTIITDTDEGNKNDGHNSWGFDGSNYPGAS